MTTRLSKIYVSDHLALLTGEIELAKRALSSNRGSDYGSFLQSLVAWLESERDSVKHIGAGVGAKSAVKQGAVWLAERAGRLKLNGRLLSYSPLSRVIEIEGLILGANARRLFWRSVRESSIPAEGADPQARELAAQKQADDLLGYHSRASVAAFPAE